MRPAAFLALVALLALSATTAQVSARDNLGPVTLDPLAPASAFPGPLGSVPQAGPAAEPAFTGAADVVGRAASLAQGPEQLGPEAKSVLAAEQQLRAAVQPRLDLGWDLLRYVQLPALPAATVMVQPAHPAMPLPATATVAALGLSGLLSALLGRLPALPLYSRIEREAAMLNERRNQLYDIVRAEPGIHLSDLVRRSGLGWGAALYHLSVLEKNRVLVAQAQGGFKRYFANGQQSRQDMQRTSALRHAASKALFEAIQHAPGCSGRELASMLGLSPSSLARASGRLEDAGLVVRVREGRKMRYFAAQTGQPAAPQQAVAA
ncbi:MAG: winged helix-turn-helix transcriptional regulator [Halobacteriales archaeon]|nr:winged helix-turn-helix transcriptional regulator [Halobacteriales archaeon]